MSDSTWMIEDDELHVVLGKAFKGEVWESVFVGHKQLNMDEEAKMKEQMMIERFTEEVS